MASPWVQSDPTRPKSIDPSGGTNASPFRTTPAQPRRRSSGVRDDCGLGRSGWYGDAKACMLAVNTVDIPGAAGKAPHAESRTCTWVFWRGILRPIGGAISGPGLDRGLVSAARDCPPG